ncbi:MAG: hypothetical protein ABSG03_39005 [Bryobacteraceae bacterium]|jgi:hypothetical protein
MMRLVFYRGPGDLITRIIRLLTNGPYSHVELQFTNGNRFFSSGHGEFQGVHIVGDKKAYGPLWDSIVIPATQEQERAAEQFTSHLAGRPFDMKCMVEFVLPWRSCPKPGYCSAIILDVLQNGLHMFPKVDFKISPNGLYRIFLSCHSTLVYSSMPDDAIEFKETHILGALSGLCSTASVPSVTTP